MDYSKGTIVIIDKILNNFCDKFGLDKKLMCELIYEDVVLEDLFKYESILIDALYNSFRCNKLVVRQDGKSLPVKTKHNLAKYMSDDSLLPLYLPLRRKVDNNTSFT